MLLFQAACLSICQYLTACHDQLDDDSDDSDSESEQAPPPYQPPPEVAPVAVKQKSKKPKRQVSEPPSQVKQIIEMGFQRKHVEYAIKALGRPSFCPITIHYNPHIKGDSNIKVIYIN